MITIQFSLLFIGVIGILIISFNCICYIPFCLIPFCPPILIIYCCLFASRGYLIIILIYTCCMEITSVFCLITSCSTCVGVIQIPYMCFYLLISFVLLNAIPCCIIAIIIIILLSPFICCCCLLSFQFIFVIFIVIFISTGYIIFNCLCIIFLCIIFSSLISPLTYGPCLCYQFLLHSIIKIILGEMLLW